MKIALLCPGPSLRLFRGHGKFYDMLIGINRAVTACRCDWWSICDLSVFRDVAPQGKPLIWTRREIQEQIQTGMCHEGFFDQFPPACRWTKYSALAGLVLSALLGSESVDCYGCDMVGTDEFDNNPLPGVNRGENRWADERHWWDQTVAMLQPMKITRIL